MPTPDARATNLPDAIADTKIQLMRRVVLVVEKNVKKRTRVKTGHLRRSWTSAVERAGERGRIGTTVRYARTQKNKPADEGLADSQDEIMRLLDEAGEALLTRIVQ